MASSVCRWVGPKTAPVDVAAGVRWLKDHIALPGQDVIAITDHSSSPDGYLIARFLEAPMMFFGSNTKFVLMSAMVSPEMLTPLHLSGTMSYTPCQSLVMVQGYPQLSSSKCRQ